MTHARTRRCVPSHGAGPLILSVVAVSGGLLGCSVWMPGRSFEGTPPALTIAEAESRERLRRHVQVLAGEIGERNLSHYGALETARDYIAEQLRVTGHPVAVVPFAHRGETFHNVEAVMRGRSPSGRCVVVGAHYDSVEGSPGANDNASGVATLLELARSLSGRAVAGDVRFVAFANEEPPYFNTGDGMGSVVYATAFEDPERTIRAMLSLETVGFYTDVRAASGTRRSSVCSIPIEAISSGSSAIRPRDVSCTTPCGSSATARRCRPRALRCRN
jgi:hypothetical protein